MSNSYLAYRGRQTPDLRRVWVANAEEIKPGYVLCFKHDATVDGADPANRMFVTAVKPATANLMLFAGIAAQKLTAANPIRWIDVYHPSNFNSCKALVKANAVAHATGLAPVDAEYSLGAHTDSLLNLPLFALAAETANTLATAANKLVRFIG